MRLPFAVLLSFGTLISPALADRNGIPSCLAQLEAYKNASSATWECGRFIGYTFPTRSCSIYEVVTASTAYTYYLTTFVHTATTTIYMPDSVAVVYTTPTQTRTHWGDDVRIIYETTIPTVTSTVTVNSVNTAIPKKTVTVISADTVKTVTVDPTTVTGPEVTKYTRALPPGISSPCFSADLEKACSLFLGPLERIYANSTIVQTNTRYTLPQETGTSTFYNEDAIFIWTPVYPMSTQTLNDVPSYIEYTHPPGTFTSYYAYTNTTRTITSTTFSPVPVTTTKTVRASSSQHFTQSTKTIAPTKTLHAQCNPTARAAGLLPVLGLQIRPYSNTNIQSLEQEPASESVETCCHACFTTKSCAGFHFTRASAAAQVPYNKCNLYIVGDSSVQGWVSDTCPNGQVGGTFRTRAGTVGWAGRGPCWNGDPPAPDDYTGSLLDWSCAALYNGALAQPAWGT